MSTSDGSYMEQFNSFRSRHLSSRQHQSNASSIFTNIRDYNDAWRSLPEEVKSGNDSQYDRVIDETSTMVKNRYGSLLNLLPSDNSKTPALIEADSLKTISQSTLSRFVKKFQIRGDYPSSGRLHVAVAIPNGALLGLLSIAVAAKYTLVPVPHGSGAEQFHRDVLESESKVVLVLEDDVYKLEVEQLERQGVDVFVVTPQPDLTCTLHALSQVKDSSSTRLANTPDDICLILFTSGTSGKRKLVPHTLHSLVAGVAYIEKSWALTKNDVCLNMMPLNHAGGLIRNLFAPILVGGSSICCPAFDANLFWDLVEANSILSPTWYYASPSMHSAILDQGLCRPESVAKSRLRMVCNAAAPLLPSLATRLQDMFGCTLLPSYGMTECMPISTPPLDYILEKKRGTSGISVGPEISFRDGSGRRVEVGTIGRLCVRGSPVFEGYLLDGKIDRSAFSNGWFDTGDLGYNDDEGYIFITGRSKEVINRGGELISPLEVEEAVIAASYKPESCIYGRITECLAFSCPHDSLQEVVGLVVATPEGEPRVDIRQLQVALKASLQSSKQPVVVLYMDAVPKRNGKPSRMKLAERCNMESIPDMIRMVDRHFEATPDGTNFTLEPVHMDSEAVVDAVLAHRGGKVDVAVLTSSTTGLLQVVLAPILADSPEITFDEADFKVWSQGKLDGYLVPERLTTIETPFPRDQRSGKIDYTLLPTMLANQSSNRNGEASATETSVIKLFSSVLGLPAGEISPGSDFFDLGGDSLRAGRLLHALRKEFSVQISVSQLFSASTVAQISDSIEESRATTKEYVEIPTSLPEPVRTYSSTNLLVLLINMMPLSIITPLRRSIFWAIFLATLRILIIKQKEFSVINFFLALFTGTTGLSIVLPIFSIIAKWTIIGTYKEGRFPMWSSYHTRWWLVDKIIYVSGPGIFLKFNWSRVMYHRLMGATIGRNAIIHEDTAISEHDLIQIGDGVELDRCVVRAFGAEHDTTMYLGRVNIGNNTSVGLKSIVAPGTDLPDNVHLGANSSSWEWKDATDSNQNLLSSRVKQPHLFVWILFGLPFVIIVEVAAFIPWAAAILELKVPAPPKGNDPLVFILEYLSSERRVLFHFGARLLKTCVSNWIYFMLTVIIATFFRLIFGRLRPSLVQDRSQVDALRMKLMSRLLPQGNVNGVAEWWGVHYELTSSMVRLLGGRIGKRVYWPGNGPSIQNFELLDIGDDVVFGSRSHLTTSDAIGSDYIHIGSGSMVADRVVVQSGVKIGEDTVLGSGTLTQRNGVYKSGAWIGTKPDGPIRLTKIERSESVDSNMTLCESSYTASKCQDCGRRSSASSGSSNHPAKTPFGRAFYQNGASYRVWGMCTIIAYSAFINVFGTFYWATPTILAFQCIAELAVHTSVRPAFEHASPSLQLLFVFGVFYTALSILHTTFAFGAIAFCVASKWVVIGQRKVGSYDWDKSDYCQRWQLYLALERFRRPGPGQDIIRQFSGTAFLVYYYRLLGMTVGKDCALFAGGRIDCLITEPDLITMGDRVCIDDASVVAHINSRGNFSLNHLEIGDRSVMRSGSRLLSGSSMLADSCLLEHTLVMGGDEIEEGTTWQGWPSQRFQGARMGLNECSGPMCMCQKVV